MNSTGPEPTVEVVEFNGPLAQDLLRRNGVSQAALARRWERDKATVTRWFQNNPPIPFEYLFDVAREAGVRPRVLASLRFTGGCSQCGHCRAAAQKAAA